MVQWPPGDVLQGCNLLFLCTHFPQICLFICWFSEFPRVLFWQKKKPQRGVFFVLERLRLSAIVIAKKVFPARESKNEERTMPQSSVPTCSNYLKLPLNRVIFHMLLTAAPQICKLWLHWISTEAAIGREVSLTALWWIAVCLIVECQCKMVSLQRNPCFLILQDWH